MIRRALEREVGIHALELRILGLQLLQPFKLGDTDDTVLRLPVVVRRLADAMLANELRHRNAGVTFQRSAIR